MHYDENNFNITLEGLNEIDKNSYILIDVRSKISFNLGNMPTSINIPKNEIDNRLDEISKDKLIIVACTMGIFSKSVTEKLREYGYKAYNLTGGYGAWLIKQMKD